MMPEDLKELLRAFNDHGVSTWKNRIEGVIDGQVQAGVISREDLIRNKLASGREQDILDVKTLRAAKQSDAT